MVQLTMGSRKSITLLAACVILTVLVVGYQQLLNEDNFEFISKKKISENNVDHMGVNMETRVKVFNYQQVEKGKSI